MSKERRAPKAHLVHQVPPDDGSWFNWSSSNVIGGRYEADGGILWLRFGDNKTGKARPVTYYVYSGVPRDVWNGLLDASSKGAFWSRYRYSFPFSGPIAA